MKKYTTIKADMMVLINPPFNRPSLALKNTAGKNKNQTNGAMYSHNTHCSPSAMNGIRMAMKNPSRSVNS